jgi:hypothetical protein
MEKEFKHGKMEPDMKEIGKIIKLMEKENFGMLMEMFLRVNGKMIK